MGFVTDDMSQQDFAGGGGDDPGTPERQVSPADMIGLVLVSARRHPLVLAAVFLLVVGAVIGYLATATPKYRVETTVLTQKAQALSPTIRSTVQDDPTRSVAEVVHRRENLLTLIQQTNLYTPEMASPAGKTRSPLVRFLGQFSGRFAESDPLEALVKRLDQALVIKINESTATITFSIEWPDPSQAYHIVEAATQNFLETRHIQEITAIDEVVSMLKGRAAALRDNLEKVTEEAQRQASRRDTGSGPEPTPIAAGPKSNDEELVRLKAMVDAKERAIQDIEEFRRRQLANLQAQLDQKLSSLTDAHPAVIALRQDIEALSHDSPQIVSLRDEHRKLQEQYQARLGQERRAAPPSVGPRAARQAQAQPASLEQNEAVKDARFQYNQVVERLNGAQLELDAARVAFKYRYIVVWPAEVPQRPVSPKKMITLAAGIPGALLLAILCAALVEMRRGTVLRRWQVERALGLPVLAELKR
jgi:uncharacterized protein involved in exopolysaccharide biosynthesis